MVDSLSEDEFRKALYESLNKKGIVSSFKSHLRQQIALQLSLKKVRASISIIGFSVPKEYIFIDTDIKHFVQYKNVF